jgi:hypothetical protein
MAINQRITVHYLKANTVDRDDEDAQHQLYTSVGGTYFEATQEVHEGNVLPVFRSNRWVEVRDFDHNRTTFYFGDLTKVEVEGLDQMGPTAEFLP